MKLPGPYHPITITANPKRIRVSADGVVIADTTHALTLKEEVIDDALAAVALLRKEPAIDSKRLFVLGHSLGAVAAPKIGEGAPALAGLILMAESQHGGNLAGTLPGQHHVVFKADFDGQNRALHVDCLFANLATRTVTSSR